MWEELEEKTAGEELELGKEDGKEKKRNRWN